MEFLQLKYFLDSAKHESFAKTAEKYMVPTTSVSASVKRLEKELNCALFNRSANRIYLNENGKRLKRSLDIAFSEIEEAIADITSIDDGREVKILVRAIRSDITDYIIEYNEKHPKTIFKTVFDFNESEYEKYDIVIDSDRAVPHGYESFKLCELNLKMKVARERSDILCKTRLEELANLPFISWGDNSNMHTILIEACKKAGFYPNIVAISNDKACYERLICAGVGIGLAREDAENDSPALSYLNLTDFDEKYKIFCYYSKESYAGSVKGFAEFLKAKAK